MHINVELKLKEYPEEKLFLSENVIPGIKFLHRGNGEPTTEVYIYIMYIDLFLNTCKLIMGLGNVMSQVHPSS